MSLMSGGAVTPVASMFVFEWPACRVQVRSLHPSAPMAPKSAVCSRVAIQQSSCNLQTDHDRGKIGVGTRDRRADRTVSHICVLKAVNTTPRIDHRHRIGFWCHLAAADRVVVVLHPTPN